MLHVNVYFSFLLFLAGSPLVKGTQGEIKKKKKLKKSFLTHVQTCSKVRESYEGFEFLVDTPESDSSTQVNLVRTGFCFAGS